MLRRLRLAITLLTILLLGACGGGSKGSSASPPSNFQAIAQDQAITMTWNDDPSVQYWVFVGPPGTTPENFVSTPGAYVQTNVTSPYTFTTTTFNNVSQALINGQDYDVTINARTNGGPGGPSSAAIRVRPRASGSSWSQGTTSPLLNGNNANTADDLLSVAYGLPLFNNNGTFQLNGQPGTFVATGANGAAQYTTLDPTGVTFTYHSVSTGVATGTRLNVVANDSALGFLTVGSSGQASYSLDGITWTPQVSGIASNLNDAISLGGSYLSVGDNCTVVGSGSGGTGQFTAWVNYTANLTGSAGFSACTGSTPPSLNSIALGVLPGSTTFLTTVGTQGTLAYTGAYTTAASWAPSAVNGLPADLPSLSNLTLRDVVYGIYYPTASLQSNGTYILNPVWVAVGDYTNASGHTVPIILYSNLQAPATWSVAALPVSLGHLNKIRASRDPANGTLTGFVVVGDTIDSAAGANAAAGQAVILTSRVLTTTTTISSSGIATATSNITSTPATVWTQYSFPGSTTPASSLKGLGFGHFSFQAVGAAGANVYTY